VVTFVAAILRLLGAGARAIVPPPPSDDERGRFALIELD
jgi:hypothetical protein